MRLSLSATMRILFFSVLVRNVAPINERQFILTASAAFRMVISETSTALGLGSQRILEEAAAEHLLLVSSYRGSRKQPEGPVRAAEVVVQEIVFRKDQAETWIRFFVLATVRVDNRDDTSEYERRLVLNTLIDDAFSTGKSHVFVHSAVEKSQGRESTAVALEDFVSATVVPFVPAVVEDPSDFELTPPEPRLSTLDIVLIAVSVCILLGILWMILVHHLDRGYFENQRLSALSNNQLSQWEAEAKDAFDEELAAHSSETHQLYSQISLAHSADEKLIDSQANTKLRNALKRPVTPIPASSRDIHLDFDENELSECSDELADSDISSDESVAHFSGREACVSSSPVATPLACPLTVGFENNLFRTPDSKRPSKSANPISPDDESIYTTNIESTCTAESKLPPNNRWNETDDYDDVFHVGDTTVQISGDDNRQLADSPDSMADWLKSIHVVPSSESRERQLKRDEIFRGAHATRAAASSEVAAIQRATTLEVGSLDHMSLEQSMASSTVASVPLNTATTL